MLRQTLFAARWIWSRNFASLTFSFWICCRSSSATRYARSFSCGSGGDDMPVRPSMMHAIMRFVRGPANRVARPRAHARCRQRGRALAPCQQPGQAPACSSSKNEDGHEHGLSRKATMLGMIAVSAEGVCRRYGRRWALVDVSFEVPEATVVMVAGRNGSGKSTLLRTLATAIRPDRGSVRILGRDAQDDRYEVRETIALLDHYTYLYEPLSALENLEIVARFLGKSRAREKLLGLLEEVGLADRADDAVRTFSAGMRK